MCCLYIIVKQQKAKSGSGSQRSFFMAGRSNDQVERMLLEVLRLLTYLPVLGHNRWSDFRTLDNVTPLPVFSRRPHP